MDENKFVYAPKYISQFECIGKDCIDSCCSGWKIELDKRSFQNYKESKNHKIRKISQKYLSKYEHGSVNSYGKTINDQKNNCPFLNKEKLCNIYSYLGKDKLSIGCSTYPRKIKQFKNVKFISAELSCPEITKLCLSDSKSSSITKLELKDCSNIYNSSNILSIPLKSNLEKKYEIFLTEISKSFESKDSTLVSCIEEIIPLSEKLYNQKINQGNNKNLKIDIVNCLKTQINFFSQICFNNNMENISRYTNICINIAKKSNFFSTPERDFQRKYIKIHKKKFKNFENKNSFLLKNVFINELLGNIEIIPSNLDSFNNLIREILFKIGLSRFLLICDLIDEGKETNVNDFIYIISAVFKNIQNSKKKIDHIVSFLKKLDNNILCKNIDLIK